MQKHPEAEQCNSDSSAQSGQPRFDLYIYFWLTPGSLIQDLLSGAPIADTEAASHTYRFGMLQSTQLVKMRANILGGGSKYWTIECLSYGLVFTGITLRPLVQQSYTQAQLYHWVEIAHTLMDITI